jgi:hypothetical protein
MKFNKGDIVRIKEPFSFQPHYWNKSFEVIEIEEDGEERWVIVKFVGGTIEIPRTSSRMQNRFGNRIIRRLYIDDNGQKDLIMVKKSDELIMKNITKHRI